MTLTVILIIVIAAISSAHCKSIFTQNVDNGRTGWNPQETILTTSNVASANFGLIGTVKPSSVPCTTQILYWENLNLMGAKNVLFCWTNNDRNNGNATVFAINADSLEVLWGRFIGLHALWTTQAPAIDEQYKQLFFIFKNNNDDGFNYLVGIDVMTGALLGDSPKLINATVAGTGDASVNGQLTFQNTGTPRLHSDSRTSMLIVNHVLFFGFAHNSDSFPYHGWVFSYSYDSQKKQFQQLAYFCVTPNDGLGGVWQGGQGIMSDGNFIYFTTGNGDFDPAKVSWSMAVIKMSFDLKLVDYFVPAKWKFYSDRDYDLGGCGPALIPGSNYMVVGVTKYGSIHLVNTQNLGKWNAQQDSCKQTISIDTGYIVPGGNPVIWNSGGTGGVSKVYMWAPNLNLVEYTYDPKVELLTIPEQWTVDTDGGGLFITSNGNTAGSAILWAYSERGAMYAFDATKPVSAGPIWKSSVPSGSASWGWPTVTNGKVYVPCGNGNIYVFGLKNE